MQGFLVPFGANFSRTSPLEIHMAIPTNFAEATTTSVHNHRHRPPPEHCHPGHRRRQHRQRIHRHHQHFRPAAVAAIAAAAATVSSNSQSVSRSLPVCLAFWAMHTQIFVTRVMQNRWDCYNDSCAHVHLELTYSRKRSAGKQKNCEVAGSRSIGLL